MGNAPNGRVWDRVWMSRSSHLSLTDGFSQGVPGVDSLREVSLVPVLYTPFCVLENLCRTKKGASRHFSFNLRGVLEKILQDRSNDVGSTTRSVKRRSRSLAY